MHRCVLGFWLFSHIGDRDRSVLTTPLHQQSNDVSEDGGGVTIKADAPLAQMFGYSTDLRSITQVRACVR